MSSRVFMVNAPGFAQWVLSSSLYKGSWSLGIFHKLLVLDCYCPVWLIFPPELCGAVGTKQLTKPSRECVCVCACVCVCVSLLRSEQEEGRCCLEWKRGSETSWKQKSFLSTKCWIKMNWLGKNWENKLLFWEANINTYSGLSLLVSHPRPPHQPGSKFLRDKSWVFLILLLLFYQRA